jgi:hypothetical protein
MFHVSPFTFHLSPFTFHLSHFTPVLPSSFPHKSLLSVQKFPAKKQQARIPRGDPGLAWLVAVGKAFYARPPGPNPVLPETRAQRPRRPMKAVRRTAFESKKFTSIDAPAFSASGRMAEWRRIMRADGKRVNRFGNSRAVGAAVLGSAGRCSSL